jgi:hypothetical protein
MGISQENHCEMFFPRGLQESSNSLLRFSNCFWSCLILFFTTSNWVTEKQHSSCKNRQRPPFPAVSRSRPHQFWSTTEARESSCFYKVRIYLATVWRSLINWLEILCSSGQRFLFLQPPFPGQPYAQDSQQGNSLDCPFRSKVCGEGDGEVLIFCNNIHVRNQKYQSADTLPGLG